MEKQQHWKSTNISSVGTAPPFKSDCTPQDTAHSDNKTPCIRKLTSEHAKYLYILVLQSVIHPDIFAPFLHEGHVQTDTGTLKIFPRRTP